MIQVIQRKLSIPSQDRVVGYEGDNLVEMRLFELDRYYGDIDLAGFDFKLDTDVGGVKNIIDLDKTVDENTITLAWTVRESHVLHPGYMAIQLRAFKGTEEKWHSEQDYVIVGPSINATEVQPDPLPSEFEQMELRITTLKEQAEASAQTATEQADRAQGIADEFENETLPAAIAGLVQSVNAKTDEVNALISAVESNETARVEAEGIREANESERILAEGAREGRLGAVEAEVEGMRLSTSRRIGDLEELINEKWTYDETAIKSVKVDSAVDADTVNGKTVEIDVPSNAKFTDTVTTINGKTGAIAKADIVALGIPAQDTVYTHPTTAGNKHIPPGGAEGKILGYGGSSGIAEWVDKPESGGKRTARFVVGTIQAGWTSADVDYLCDGVDDQVEIIEALNALPEGGGEIVILDGEYNITASINIPKDNVSIRGSGKATILKRMYNSTTAARGLITLSSRSGCKIADLQLNGNKASYTASDNCGIYLSTSSNNIVAGNTCNNNSHYGIYLQYDSSSNIVAENTCNNNNYYGIAMRSLSRNNIVTGNVCCNNYYGVFLGGSNNTIIGNVCYNNNAGVYLYTSNNNAVTGNTCIRGTGKAEDYSSSQYTILLYGTGNNYNLISSNNCMGKAVVISGGTGNSAWGNKFDNTNDLP